MTVGRRLSAQQREHLALRGRLAQKIASAKHVRDSLVGVIDHDREGVGMQPIAPAQYEIVRHGRAVLRAENEVVEHRLGIERETQGAGVAGGR